MSIEVIYQGLTIAKGPSFRLQDGGVFVELDGPMPVATQLSLAHGDHALHGRVRRVAEGAGAGMLVVPTKSAQLPRWLVALGPSSISNVELEPEPVAPVVVETKAASEPETTAVQPETAEKVEAKAEPAAPETTASTEPSPEGGEPAAASGHTPSEHEGGKDEEEDDKHAAKSTDKKTPAGSAGAKKKKPRKR